MDGLVPGYANATAIRSGTKMVIVPMAARRTSGPRHNALNGSIKNRTGLRPNPESQGVLTYTLAISNAKLTRYKLIWMG